LFVHVTQESFFVCFVSLVMRLYVLCFRDSCCDFF